MGSFFTNVGGKRTKGVGTWKRKPSKKWFPKKDRCFWCLEDGHRITDCQRRQRGEKVKQRPDGTYYKGRSWTSKDQGKSNPTEPQSFQSFSFNVEASSGESEWLVDSGCNKHLTPFKEDLEGIKDSNITCTFRNKMRPRAERGILVGHDMGAAAYVVHLPRLKRVVTRGQLHSITYPERYRS